MTATAHDVSRRRAPYKASTFAGRLSVVCLAAADSSSDIQWPSERYREDPVAFCREVLGVEPWQKQIEILEAIRDHKRVAVRSGHKVGKSHSAAVAALWFFCAFEDARVVLTSTTSRQVDTILWREIKKLVSKAKKPINVEPPHELARSGLKAPDFREIVGFTAKEAEAVAGVSGKNLLYLPDEASGIPDAIFEAMEGNRAGGARVAMFSNPTRAEGEFFDAFHDKERFYKTIHVSAEHSPNVIAGHEVIPGLVERPWIEEKREEWGVDSAAYKIRVKGEFVLNEEGKIISLHALGESEARWEETPTDGRLFIGVDPAGPGEEGDEWGYSTRRGFRQLALEAKAGLASHEGLAKLLGIIIVHRKRREQKPIVVVDALGKSGAEFVGVCRAYLEDNPEAFELVAVRGSDRAVREPGVYDHVRDELWAGLARWVKDGGALLTDTKLVKEITAPSWHGQISGRLRATDKKILRKVLGRSPDRADATTLSVWEPMSLAASDDTPRPVAHHAPDDDLPDESPYRDPGLSPYGSDF
jgi:phage terminase large subunit